MRFVGLSAELPSAASGDDVLLLRLLEAHPIATPEPWMQPGLARLVSLGWAARTDAARNGYTSSMRESYAITPLGLEELRRRDELAQQRAQGQAQEEAKEAKAERLRVEDTRRSWRQFWLGVLLGWVLGGYTFRELVHWVLSLFQ